MKIFKPLDLSLQHSQFTWNGKNHIAVSIIIGFPFNNNEILLEQDLWKLIPGLLGKDQILDMGMPKPNAEVLVTGNAYATKGKVVSSMAISFAVGDLKKELVVYGDRYWGFMGMSEAEPFREMAVDYNHAFGGKEYKKNPLGKGMEDVDVFGEMRRPLPNIELPDQVMTSKGQIPEPASFGPIDLMWEQRASKIGTYDDKWLKDRAPGYADDLDWSYFNAAPKDQWLDGFLNGDETFSIVNMHPEKQSVEGKLPGFRTRCFVNQRKQEPLDNIQNDKKQEDLTFKEIEMKAETVWIFPEAETGILIYRGTMQIHTDDASDIEHMIIAYENLDDSLRNEDHYKNALTKRLDPDKGFLYMMDTTEMIPDGVRCGFVRMLEAAGEDTVNAFGQNMDAKAESLRQEVEKKLEEQRQQLTEQLTQANIDLSPYIEKLKLEPNSVSDDPDVKELMAIVDKVMPGAIDGDTSKFDFKKLDMSKMHDLNQKMSDIAENKKQDAKQQISTMIAEFENKIKDNEKLKEPLSTKINELQTCLENIDKKPELPRPPNVDVLEQVHKQVKEVEQKIEQMRLMGVDEAELPKIEIDINEVENNIQEMCSGLKKGYLSGAHYIEGRPPHKEPLDIILHRFKKDINKGESIAGGDYAGIDLSGMDLSGVDFRSCYLEYVNFSGAILHNANFKNAILAHANLSKAKLQGANLEGANIGDANLMNADLTGSNMKDAILSKSNLKRAKLVQCNLQGITEILQADLTEVDMSESVLTSINLLDTPIDNAKFIKTQMSNTNFINCSLNGTDFSGCMLDGSNWVGIKADNAVFNEASMINNRFPDKSSLKQASFVKAKLDKSNFREVNLEGSDFTEASFEMADFGEANLQKASFYCAIGKRSQFIKADLADANMSSMNMMEGTLMKARLTNADFTYSNLYAVEFMNATVGGTDFSHANLDMSKLQDWRPSK